MNAEPPAPEITESLGVPTPPTKPANPERATTSSIYLLIGAFIVLVSAGAFYAIADDVIEQDPIVHFDQMLADFVHLHVTGTTLIFIQLFTRLGSEIPTIVSVIAGLIFLRRRYWKNLSLVLVGMGGGALLVALMKALFGRPRPVFANPIQILSDFSFPSGHSFFAVAFYGLIAYFLVQRFKSPLAHLLIYLAALVIVLLVGFTRIYLGVHFLSDVLGGYFAGLGWLIFTLTGVEYMYRRRARHSPHPA